MRELRDCVQKPGGTGLSARKLSMGARIVLLAALTTISLTPGIAAIDQTAAIKATINSGSDPKSDAVVAARLGDFALIDVGNFILTPIGLVCRTPSGQDRRDTTNPGHARIAPAQP